MAKAASGRGARIVIPPNLSFRRSIDVSEASMFSVLPDEKAEGGEKLVPVVVTTKTLRGAIASYNAGYAQGGEPLSGKALESAQNPAKPNIQSIDRAELDPGSDKLLVRFSVAFHGANREADSCGDADFTARLRDFHVAAREAGLHRELAARYLWNLVNGRTLWRNAKTGVPDIVRLTDVSHGEKPKHLEFEFAKIPTDRFPGIPAIAAACIGGGEREVSSLVDKIAGALDGTGVALLPLDVDVRVKLYKGAEVWPSQEFCEETQKVRGGRELSRVLSSRTVNNQRHATIHSQKIGNAIRTIDEWHGDDAYGAVPVEAFGWVQRDLVAIRRPSDRADAYAAFSDVAGIAAALRAGETSRGLYALAMIIRGGVYGVKAAGKEKAPAEAEAEAEG